jgi:nucleoside-diphosphate-sugar epimerase
MITILGDRGFVGSSLKKRFGQLGKECCGLSRPSFDLIDISTYTKIPQKTKIVIHAAGISGTGFSSESYWRESVQSTYELIDFLNRERQLDLFMYASSGAVYKPSNTVLNEKSRLKPENLYGLSRLLSENIITTLANSPTVIMRLFFPFGPGQKSPRLIQELARKITEKESIILNNELGLPKINPIFIGDLVDQIIEIIEKPDAAVVNLGGSEVVSIKHLAEIIGEALKIQPIFKVEKKNTLNLFCEPFRPNSKTLLERLKEFL